MSALKELAAEIRSMADATQAEADALAAAADKLDPRSAVKSKTPARKRARKGELEAKVVEVLSRDGRQTASQLAATLGRSPQQMYPLLSRLERRRLVRKMGKEFVASRSAGKS